MEECRAILCTCVCTYMYIDSSRVIFPRDVSSKVLRFYQAFVSARESGPSISDS